MPPSSRPPLLPRPLREQLEAWLAEGAALHGGSLDAREWRTGVQALSAIYVEGRHRGRLAARSVSSPAKRAAFATYYAALHFLTVVALAQALRADDRFGADWPGPVVKLLDLGCGTGAAGAAAARVLFPDGRTPTVVGVDVSGWALADARRTWRAFGLRGRSRRRTLPAGAGRPGECGLAVAGWALNELDGAARRAMRDWAASHLARGGALLVVEPLAGSTVPWWEEWRRALEPAGCVDGSLKVEAPRLEPIERLDRASGLDHRVLGARWLAGPVAAGPPEDKC